MPIYIDARMPVVRELFAEQIPVAPESSEYCTDKHNLEIAILNIMPNKQDTELQILRLLSNTPLRMHPTFLRLDSHAYKHVPEEYLHAYYASVSDAKKRHFDGLICTGAPVETMPFEQVDYWKELTELMSWADQYSIPTMYLCWSAQAGLYYHYGIQKHPLLVKLSGVYRHRTLDQDDILTRGFDDVFLAPHSRYTGIAKEDIQRRGELDILAESDAAGVYLIHDRKKRRLFVTGHPEYSRATLANEYTRDLAKGIHPAVPEGYFPDGDPAAAPLFLWRAHANLLFSNWLNYEAHQAAHI